MKTYTAKKYLICRKKDTETQAQWDTKTPTSSTTEQVDKNKTMYLGRLDNVISKTELADVVTFYRLSIPLIF